MPLTTAAISARAPERRMQELLNEFYRAFFHGQSHSSPLGDATFPACDLLFNQADAPDPQAKPQIHTVFTGWRGEEHWYVSGTLGTWAETLYNVASGVSYGRTTAGTIEESVHGHPARVLTGTDIRWTTQVGGFVEEVRIDGDWIIARTLPAGTTALRWQRTGSTYVEQANIAGTWTTLRTISPAHEVWDGTKVLVTADVELSHFIRVKVAGGDANKSDFLAREVAANLDELLRDTERTRDLGQKGVRHLTHRSGPRPMPTSGYQTRLLVYTAQLHYFLPKEGQ